MQGQTLSSHHPKLFASGVVDALHTWLEGIPSHLLTPCPPFFPCLLLPLPSTYKHNMFFNFFYEAIYGFPPVSSFTHCTLPHLEHQREPIGRDGLDPLPPSPEQTVMRSQFLQRGFYFCSFSASCFLIIKRKGAAAATAGYWV